jgi:hypothetical protein
LPVIRRRPLLALVLVAGCSGGAPPASLAPAGDGGGESTDAPARGDDSGSSGEDGGGGGLDATSSPTDATTAHDTGAGPIDAGVSDAFAPFVLGPEWNGPCTATNGAIDVNLGNSPESFVRAAYCQIHGTEPPASTVANWASQLRTVSYVRRIDVVRTLCQQANHACALSYSDPWLDDPALTTPCTRKTSRDIGAVMMFFFGCPGGTNCGMDWANTHAFGMQTQDPIYDNGGYVSTNEGFWLRELLDARYAGLQFMMPNVYGYDIQPGTNAMANLEAALTTIDGMGGGMKVGLFNDTWAWGNPAGGALMNPAPNLSDTQAAAQQIYDVQWKPFFSGLSQAHWYTVNGQPLIYFYNAGTLLPITGASAVIAAMKQLFQNDFGVTPFVDVDRGYGPTASADAVFVWDTFTNDATTNLGTATTLTGGLTFDNSMVKWDSLGRDDPGAIATSTDRIFKGPGILDNVLQTSSGANLLLLETWNDLGEGTGITRNYDYYVAGGWISPAAFMDSIRASQCSN